MRISETESRSGGEIWRIDCVELRSKTIGVVWIDPTYKNYRRWSSVIACRALGQILSGIRIKDRNRDPVLLDGDSKIYREWTGSKMELADRLETLWYS